MYECIDVQYRCYTTAAFHGLGMVLEKAAVRGCVGFRFLWTLRAFSHSERSDWMAMTKTKQKSACMLTKVRVALQEWRKRKYQPASAQVTPASSQMHGSVLSCHTAAKKLDNKFQQMQRGSLWPKYQHFKTCLYVCRVKYQRNKMLIWSKLHCGCCASLGIPKNNFQ